MSTSSSLLTRTIAAPGAFVGAALVIYAVAPFGAAEPKAPTQQPEARQQVAQATPSDAQGEAVTTLLSAEQSAILQQQNWENWVGNGVGIWVSVDEQMFRVIRGQQIIWQEPCGTAARGTGSQMNSNKTPLGWHSIKKKIGDGAAIGQVFRNSKPTKEVWQPGQKVKEDLVLTRIMWLTGEEPGKNLGGNVDSYSRYIYIHGTNEEEKIGTPSSHGCVRLRNADVAQVYGMVPEGTPVLITEVPKPKQ